MDRSETATGTTAGELSERWLLLTASCVVLLFAHGFAIHAMPFLYPAVMADTGWSRAQVTLLPTIQFGSGAIATVLFGRVMDRIGDYRAIMIAIVVNAIAICTFLLVKSLASFYAVGLAFGISTPGVFTGVKTLVSRRFTRRQGTAVGIALTGTDIGGAIIPVVIVLLLAQFNWRVAIALTTLGTWLIALPLFLLAAREERTDPRRAAIAAATPAAEGSIWVTLRTISRGADFWLIAISVFLVGAVDMGIGQHQVLYLTHDRHLSPALVAAVATGFAVVSILAKILFGAIYDRFSIVGIAAAYLLLAVDPILATLVIGPLTAICFVLTRGLAHGAIITDVPVLSKQVYGNADIGFVIGIFSACLQMGFAVGPWIMGQAYSIAGSYVPGFLLFAGLALLAAAMVSRVQPRFWRASRA